LSQACRRYAKRSSISFCDRHHKNAHTAEDESVKSHSKSICQSSARPCTHKTAGVTLRPLCPDSDQVRAATQDVAMGHVWTHAPQQGRYYSTTSSARVSSKGGTVTPRAFAVLRLITKLNLVRGQGGWSRVRRRQTPLPRHVARPCRARSRGSSGPGCTV